MTFKRHAKYLKKPSIKKPPKKYTKQPLKDPKKYFQTISKNVYTLASNLLQISTKITFNKTSKWLQKPKYILNHSTLILIDFEPHISLKINTNPYEEN